MKKTVLVLLVFVLLLPTFTQAETEAAVRLAALKGPTAMGLVHLLDTQEAYDFLLAGSADEITPKLIKGEIDIASIPVNLAAVLYQKTQGALELIALNTLGVLYIVEKGGEELHTISDLKGKTLYATGKGSTPEYNLTYLLKAHGLTLGSDVRVEWRSEPTEVLALMNGQKTAIAMLPQPYVTVAGTQLPDLRIALDLTQEWDRLGSDSRLITAGIVVRKAFAKEHPEKVERFLHDFAESAAFVNEKTEAAAELVEKYGIVKAAVARKALPACNIVCITGEEMKTALSGYLKVLYTLNAVSVGGALPADDFYGMYEIR